MSAIPPLSRVQSSFVLCVSSSLYRFKSLYHLLKDMKSEIEHRQHLLEKAKVQLQKDFETWWEKEANRIREKVWGEEGEGVCVECECEGVWRVRLV